MSVLGIDLDTSNITYALLDDDGVEATIHQYRIRHKHGSFYAARHARDHLPGGSWYDQHNVWLAGIEKPMDARNPGTLMALARVQGAILASLPPGLTVIETAPQEWVKLFTKLDKIPVNRVERKGVVADRVEQLLERELGDWSYDMTDAYGIAFVARDLNDRGIQAAQTA
jgi:Holliday junction resolvasome RuvABC endonuclease subunit